MKIVNKIFSMEYFEASVLHSPYILDNINVIIQVKYIMSISDNFLKEKALHISVFHCAA